MVRRPTVVLRYLNNRIVAGLRWIDYVDMDEEAERAHMIESIRRHTAIVGERPLGWYTGRNSANTGETLFSALRSVYTAAVLP